MKKKNLFKSLNVPKMICENLLSEHHNQFHRMFVGSIIIGFGVMMAKIEILPFIHSICEAVGYLIHGIGSIPFIESLSNLVHDE